MCIATSSKVAYVAKLHLAISIGGGSIASTCIRNID